MSFRGPPTEKNWWLYRRKKKLSKCDILDRDREREVEREREQMKEYNLNLHTLSWDRSVFSVIVFSLLSLFIQHDNLVITLTY